MRGLLILGHRANKRDVIERYKKEGVDGFEIDIQWCDGKLCLKHGLRKKKMTGLTRLLDRILSPIILGDPRKPMMADEAIGLYEGVLWLDIKFAGEEEKIVKLFRKYDKGPVYYTSFLPDVVKRLSELGVERFGPILYMGEKKAIEFMESGCNVISVHHRMVTKSLVEEAKKRGVTVAVWTVDDPDVAQRLVKLGVDVIITNKPALIRKAVESVKG